MKIVVSSYGTGLSMKIQNQQCFGASVTNVLLVLII